MLFNRLTYVKILLSALNDNYLKTKIYLKKKKFLKILKRNTLLLFNRTKSIECKSSKHDLAGM